MKIAVPIVTATWDPSKLLDRTAMRKKCMSPPGALGLPENLEKKRLEYLITDGYFEYAALYERIYVFQLFEAGGGETFLPGGQIIKTQQEQAADHFSAPRGVIVSAGASALDKLRSNGADLGDTVSFIQQAPWRMKVEILEDGFECWAIVLNVGDIQGCLETRQRMLKGGCSLRWNEENRQHDFVDAEGKIWVPQTPFAREDF